MPSAVICWTSGASACAFSNFDLRTYSPGKPGVSWTFLNGPAAKAKRYVLIGLVSSNSVRLAPLNPDTALETVPDVLEITLQSTGESTVSLNFPFKSGWSKHGNAMSASIGTNSV